MGKFIHIFGREDLVGEATVLAEGGIKLLSCVVPLNGIPFL